MYPLAPLPTKYGSAAAFSHNYSFNVFSCTYSVSSLILVRSGCGTDSTTFSTVPSTMLRCGAGQGDRWRFDMCIEMKMLVIINEVLYKL